MHVGPEGAGDGGEPAPAGLAAHPADHLADQVPVGVRVVGVPGAGLPPRVGRGQRGGHPPPVPQVLVGQRLADGRHRGTVAQRVAQRRPLLAAGGELGPDGRNGVVEGDAPTVDELEREERQKSLPHRVEVDQGVALQGCRRSSSRHPPARSTTVVPSMITCTAAPTSPRSVKLRANSSFTWVKRASQLPFTGASMTRLCRPVAGGANGAHTRGAVRVAWWSIPRPTVPPTSGVPSQPPLPVTPPIPRSNPPPPPRGRGTKPTPPAGRRPAAIAVAAECTEFDPGRGATVIRRPISADTEG